MRLDEFGRHDEVLRFGRQRPRNAPEVQFHHPPRDAGVFNAFRHAARASPRV
jgi:hypothetical protein